MATNNVVNIELNTTLSVNITLQSGNVTNFTIQLTDQNAIKIYLKELGISNDKTYSDMTIEPYYMDGSTKILEESETLNYITKIVKAMPATAIKAASAKPATPPTTTPTPDNKDKKPVEPVKPAPTTSSISQIKDGTLSVIIESWKIKMISTPASKDNMVVARFDARRDVMADASSAGRSRFYKVLHNGNIIEKEARTYLLQNLTPFFDIKIFAK